MTKQTLDCLYICWLPVEQRRLQWRHLVRRYGEQAIRETMDTQPQFFERADPPCETELTADGRAVMQELHGKDACTR